MKNYACSKCGSVDLFMEEKTLTWAYIVGIVERGLNG